MILYLLIRVVRDDGASHLAGIAARIAIGIVLLALAVGGFAAAAAGTALGGGIAIAGLSSPAASASSAARSAAAPAG